MAGDEIKALYAKYAKESDKSSVELWTKLKDLIIKKETKTKLTEDDYEVVEVKTFDDKPVNKYAVNLNYIKDFGKFEIPESKTVNVNSKHWLDVCGCGDMTCQTNAVHNAIKKKPKNVDEMLEGISKKDLLATIRQLLHEQGRTTVRMVSGGEYISQDTIISIPPGNYCTNFAFRSLIDASEQQDITDVELLTEL